MTVAIACLALFALAAAHCLRLHLASVPVKKTGRGPNPKRLETAIGVLRRLPLPLLLVSGACLLTAAEAGAWRKQPQPSFPEVAMAIAADLDRQLYPRLGMGTPTNSRGLYWLVVTVPASLENLNVSSPLGRLMAQELMSAFVAKGYNVQEVRKTREIVFSPQGEFMLSRDVNALATKRVLSTLVLAATYTPTAAGVRFNVEVINAANNSVVAMSSRTAPLSPSVGMLMENDRQGVGGLSRPNVATTDLDRFQREMIPYSGR